MFIQLVDTVNLRIKVMNNFQKITAVLATTAVFVYTSPAAQAVELTVKITGPKSTLGKMGCALFASADGFPFDTSKANAQVVPVDAATTTCLFSNIAVGTYAVGVVHDLNGNEKVDKNFLGVPTESWAVSNNISHLLRAPTFEEAAFKLDGNLQINLRLVH
jgi:uncharacterized protein (DUF2141 family)